MAVSSVGGLLQQRAPTWWPSSPTRRPSRLVGALLLEQNDEWAVQRRYMSLETLEGLSDDPQARPRRIAAA